VVTLHLIRTDRSRKEVRTTGQDRISLGDMEDGGEDEDEGVGVMGTAIAEVVVVEVNGDILEGETTLEAQMPLLWVVATMTRMLITALSQVMRHGRILARTVTITHSLCSTETVMTPGRITLPREK